MKRAKSKADFFLIIQEELTKRFCPLTVSRLCAICGVSRSGYYRWVVTSHARLQREKKDEADFHLILEAYRFRGFDKGVQSIHMRLLRQKNSVRMNVKKIRRLMRKFGLWCPIRQGNPYRQMAKALRTNAVADNHLKREFREHGPRAVLLTDITYIPYNSRFCYPSVIKDAYTKQILSIIGNMKKRV